MGFGRGRGFTHFFQALGAANRLRTETIIMSTMTNPKGGGGKLTRTETVLTTTVELASGAL